MAAPERKVRYVVMTEDGTAEHHVMRTDTDNPNSYYRLATVDSLEIAAWGREFLDKCFADTPPPALPGFVGKAVFVNPRITGIAVLTPEQRADAIRRVRVDGEQPMKIAHEYSVTPKQLRDMVRRAPEETPAPKTAAKAATVEREIPREKSVTTDVVPTFVLTSAEKEAAGRYIMWRRDRGQPDAIRGNRVLTIDKQADALAMRIVGNRHPAKIAEAFEITEKQVTSLINNHGRNFCVANELPHGQGRVILARVLPASPPPPVEPPEPFEDDGRFPKSHEEGKLYRATIWSIAQWLRSREMKVLRCGADAWRIGDNKSVYTNAGLAEFANELRPQLDFPLFELIAG